MDKKDLIVICGPTASGKTSLAVKTAEMISEKNEEKLPETEYLKPAAEIISADSRQVYRKMDIGTGKDLGEYKTDKIEIPFHCIDIRNPDDYFTLYDYLDECRVAVESVRGRKRIPLLAGGTGLYVEAVIKNYKLQEIPPDLRLRGELEKLETATLEEKLKKLNRRIYRETDLSSRKRIIRGIEKSVYLEKSGRESRQNTDSVGYNSLKNTEKYIENSDTEGSEDEQINLNNEKAYPENISKITENPLVLVTRWDRKILVSRIEKRLDERIEEGMIEEVQSLLDSGITPERLLFFGLEYRYITEYLTGRMDFKSMREKLFTEIRRFSKRQVTFFRGMERRGIQIHYIDNADAEKAMDIINRCDFPILLD